MVLPGALGVLTVCGVVALSGCDPVRGALTIRNDTTQVVQIFHGDAVIQTVPSERQRQVVLGDAGECLHWALDAVGSDGTVVASLNAPICDEDVWTIDDDGGGKRPTPIPRAPKS